MINHSLPQIIIPDEGHRCSSPTSGRVGRGRAWSCLVFLVSSILLVLSLFGFAATSSAQGVVVTGNSGKATYRAFVNFKGMVLAQELYGITNQIRLEMPAPMPMEYIQRPDDTPALTGTPSSYPESKSGAGGGGSGGGQFSELVSPLPSPAPDIDFRALDDNQFVIPPDTHGAVGPNHVMTTLNSDVRIQDRIGTNISTLPLNAFWQSVGIFQAFDPKCLYDPYSERWMFTAMADARSSSSSILMAVSQTDDPTGNWFLYRVDADINNLNWADYPSMGFNKDWIVVTANMFPIFTGANGGVNLYVFNKTNLYSGGVGLYTLLQENSGRGFTMVPAITYDQELDTIHLVEVDNLIGNYDFGRTSSFLRLSQINGPVGAERLTVGSAAVTATNSWGNIDPVFFPGFLPQLGSSLGIIANDTRIQNAVYRNNSLWCTHTAFLPASAPNHSAAQWWEIQPNEGRVIQFGRMEDTRGIVSYAFPSIAVNRCGDVLIGFSRFSTNEYASAAYAFRSAGDPLNTLRSDYVFKEGEGPYYKDFSFGFGRNRWGDYSSTVVDPLNDLDFWTIQEYAATPDLTDFFDRTGRWGTWWAKVGIGGTDDYRFEFTTDQYTVSEAPPPGFATIEVLNIGGAAGSVDYFTSDGTALSGLDYFPASGTLVFAPGQLSASFSIQVIDNADVNDDKTVFLTLTNAVGNAVLGCLTNAVLTIVDDEAQSIVSTAGEINFSSYLNSGYIYSYRSTENESYPFFCGAEGFPDFEELERSTRGVLITVARTNGATGKILVDYATVDGGTAVPYADYIPVSGTLVLDDYQMSTNFIVPVLNDLFFFVTNQFGTINLLLSNPRPAPEEELARPGLVRPTLGPGSVSMITIFNVNNGYCSFSGTSVTNIALTCVNAFAWERLNWRVDEYEGRDPRLPGGLNFIDVSIILPLGGPGSVRVFVPNHWATISGAGVVGVTLEAGSDYAARPAAGFEVLPNPSFTDTSLFTITNEWDYTNAGFFTVSFGSGQCRRYFRLAITNDAALEFNEDILLQLFSIPNNPIVNPLASRANLTIVHDDQPAGALDRDWNPDLNPNTIPSFNPTPGANNVVNAVAAQTDGKSIIGGDFTTYNARPRNRVARLNQDGSLDLTFNPGTGADGFVSALALYPDTSANTGRVLIGGGFSSYNGFQRNGIARLAPDGSLDTTFRPGNGVNGTISTILLQSDEKIIIAGNFTEVNNINRNGIARLNNDGSVDETFDAGSGPLGNIWSLVLEPGGFAQPDKIFVGGDFFFFGDEFRAGVVRLTSTGAVDLTFDPGGGVDGSVFAMGLQADGNLVIAGSFTEYDARRRMGLARTFPDGSLDPSFDPGEGPDNPVFALVIQGDQKAVIGGPFTKYNGTRRVGLARLRLDGALDTSFMDTAYNQFAGIINPFSFQPPNYLNSISIQPDGNIMIAGSFQAIGGNPAFTTPLREVNPYILEDSSVVFTRADKRFRFNVARVIGGTTPGPGNVSYETENYYTDENAGVASIKLSRTDGRLGTLVGEAGTLDRTATEGIDYSATNLIGRWPEAFYQTNINRTFPILFPTNFSPISVGLVDPIYLPIPILDDALQEGDEQVDLNFLRPGGFITLAGEYIPLGGALGRSSASLVIADNDFNAGVINFASATYFTNEVSPFAIINLVRTEGTVGRITVDYMTSTNVAPPRAIAGEDYTRVSGTISFQSGQSTAFFLVPIKDDTIAEFDENIGLVLTNATGGAKLPGGTPVSIASSILTIVDNDFPPGRLSFGQLNFVANERDGAAVVTVTRTAGNSGEVTVQFETQDGTAIAGQDYASTNGVLHWDHGDAVPKTFRVPLYHDGLVEGPQTVNLRLFDPRFGGTPNNELLGFQTNAVLVIEDGDAYGQAVFSQSSYQADENGGSVLITVDRVFGIAGTGSVMFATSADSAMPGQDYIETSGTLVFLPGEISKTFPVTLLDDDISDGNRTVRLNLLNPDNLGLGLPNPVILTIIDNESFNEPAGSADVTFAESTQANGPVFAIDLHRTNNVTDGRIVVAGDFTDFDQVVRNRLARLLPNGNLDTSFDPGPGANGAIRTLVSQPDGRLLIGGFFSEVLGTNRNGIARLSSDGTLDSFFNPGAGADNPVYKIILQPDERILVGGGFSTFNSISRPGIVRLNTNGTVDASFNVGGGPNNAVFAIAQQGDGKILIGGEFTSVDNVPRGRIARLNPNGSLDLSFNPGLGAGGTVRAVLVQADGKIVIGGSFTNYNGTARNFLARLNSDGSLDTEFLNGLSGGDTAVFDLALQVDGKLIVVGDFSRFNGVTRNRITRLNPDGSTDPGINFGSGANSFIASVIIQPDRKILIGGGFTLYDDRPRLRIARIHGGALDGPGQLEFSKPQFIVQESVTNAQIVVRRRGGTAGEVGVNYRAYNGTALAGQDFTAVTGPLIFPQAETYRSFVVPVIDNFIPDGDRFANLELVPGTYTGGATKGLQPSATLLITDNEGSIGFTASNYSVSEGIPSGLATILVHRQGGTNNPVSVEFATTNGTAAALQDYYPTNGILNFAAGEVTKNFHVRIINDTNIEGNETVVLKLRNPSNSNVLNIATSTLLILDNDFGPGQIQFSTNSYHAIEGHGNIASLTVIRTNGSTGIVAVGYRTGNGVAVSPSDFVGTNDVIAFADGETVKTIRVAIVDDPYFEPSESFTVTLFNASGGASLGFPTNATVNIVDNDTNNIVAAGSMLLSESIQPPNNLIDPGETVTLSLGLRNIGTSDSVNLIGSIVPRTGISQPSGPQTYGALLANGPAIFRNYSFTAVGSTGDQVVVSLLLTDGGSTNGFVNFGFTLSGRAVRTFSNTNTIVINDDSFASPYPANITVANLGGSITNISITLSNVTHPYPADLDVLLVSPQGKKATLMSDAGGSFGLSGTSITFDPRATVVIPEFNQILSQTYLPTNYAGFGTADSFPPPAPTMPYTNSNLKVFNGDDPNGIWSLYIVDDDLGDAGFVNRGWSITFHTTDPVVEPADLALNAFALPSSQLAIGSSLTCVLTVTNYGPASASGVVVQDELPASFTLMSASASKGTWSQSGNGLQFNVGSLASGAGAKLTVVAKPTQPGVISSKATVSGQQSDVIKINNEITMVTTVMEPAAMSVLKEDGVLIISWPANSGYVLQASATLTSPNWSDVAITPTVIDGMNRVIILTNNGSRFYRLRAP